MKHIKILRIFSEYPMYLFLGLGMMLSSIGTGLSQIAVYGALSNLGSGASNFGIAFALGMVPGMFASQLASTMSQKNNLGKLLIASQMIGAFGILIPIFGIQRQSVPLLLVAEFISASVIGFSFPLMQTIISRVFKGDDLGTVIKLDTAIFSINVILGTGVGTLLYDLVSPQIYLWVDFFSYIFAAAFIFISVTFSVSAYVQNQPEHQTEPVYKIRWRDFTPEQNRAFLLLPFLALVATPAMALLPYFGTQRGKSVVYFGISLTPALMFIFAKCVGQMLGPVLVSKKTLEKGAGNTKLIVICLCLFLGFYSVVASAEKLVIALLFVIIAHICSNVIYTIGVFSVQRQFSSEQMPSVSALQYQLSLVIMTLGSLISGYLAQSFSSWWS